MPDLFAEKLADIERRQHENKAKAGMWLAHHWPEHHQRCAIIGGRRVCRRCLVLYPVTFAVAVAAAVWDLLLWPRSLDPALIWLLSIPGTVEYLADQLGFLGYNAKRQAIATVLVAIPLGRGLSYELDDRWHWYFWGPLLVFGTIWFVSTIVGRATRRS